MVRPGIIAICLVGMLCGTFAPPRTGTGPWAGPGTTPAPEAWRKEFEEVCSRTGDAMSFSAEELKGLVARCDSLKPRIEALDETQKKVYLKRLRLCRDLYRYVLETKERD